MIYTGNCLDILPTLPAQSVHCCVTSPPYWGLRDYGHADQLGNERTPAEYVQRMVQVFREVKRVLRDDGTVFVNLGDTYGSGKQLTGIPWRVAFALQDDDWILRQDIIWHKPNPMPESVQDRCTKAHEYVFLLTKQPRYYYDAKAIMEPADPKNYRKRATQRIVPPGQTIQSKMDARRGEILCEDRNRRSVWSVSVNSYSRVHFAVMPPKLVEPCILAGCPVGGVVLDPFAGSGTTGAVATSLGRNFVGIELNPAYVELAEERIGNSQPALQFEAQP
jgi:site-specific DNA-methyltransferase (adenine-specific)